MTNTAAKRLSEKDVKAVFSSIAKNEKPPQRLKFKIIRVAHNGLKLSPPPFEFPEGIYVLIRAPRGKAQASLPSSLKDQLLCDSELASLPPLPWSLSGPQYPKKNQQVQQRYCYPKNSRGDPYYSNKGGSMWTSLDSKGNEDIDCRIFHVYRSNKRAGTASTNLASAGVSTDATGTGTRKSKRKSGGGGGGNGKKNRVITTSATMDSLSCLPEIDHSSFDMDTSLTFTSDNLFASADKSNNNFSFMPVVPSTVTNSNSFDSMLLQNNPAFNSFVGRPGASSSYYYPPHSYWASTAPPIPELTTSDDKASALKTGGVVSSVASFSARLQDMEASLHADILGSSETDQVLKMHLLQNWAKEIAQAPLETTKATAQPAKEEESVQAPLQPKEHPALESLQPPKASAPVCKEATKASAPEPPKSQEASAAGSTAADAAATGTHADIKMHDAPGTPPIIQEV